MAAWWQSRKNGSCVTESPLSQSKVNFKLITGTVIFLCRPGKIAMNNPSGT